MEIYNISKENINNEEINNFFYKSFNKYRLLDNFSNFICYYNNNELIGLVAIEKEPKNIILLTGLCVKHEERNKGIATKILNYILNNNKDKIIGLFVDKNKKNTEYLYNFYIKRGFKNHKTFKNLKINNNIEYFFSNK
jgi:N-acetylglutamate synthase-like GNAT family acetyltransferase